MHCCMRVVRPAEQATCSVAGSTSHAFFHVHAVFPCACPFPTCVPFSHVHVPQQAGPPSMPPPELQLQPHGAPQSEPFGSLPWSLMLPACCSRFRGGACP
eukprot:354903-Chlamydomonas_euryale.AAC.2